MAEESMGSKCSDSVYDFFCQSCINDGKHCEASGFCTECKEYLCGECCKYHGRLGLTRHHSIQGKADMPRDVLPSRMKDCCTDTCHQHKGKLAEYFCSHHDCFCCHVCAITRHKHCSKVDFVPDASSTVESKESYKEFEKKIELIQKQLETTLKQALSNITKCQQQHSETVTAVKQFIQDIVVILKRLGEDINKVSLKLATEDTTKMNHNIKTCEKLMSDSKTMKSDFQQLAKNKQYCQMFKTLKKEGPTVNSLENKAQLVIKTTQVRHYKFQPDHQVLELLKLSRQLGKLCVEDPWAKTATHLADIKCKSESDGNNCWITGSVVVGAYLVCCDHSNKKVKLFSTTLHTLLQEVKLASEPWDIAAVCPNAFAVTLPDQSSVVLLQQNKTLYIDREIKVGKGCYGIAYGSSCKRLYFTFALDRRVEVWTLDGKHLLTITIDKAGKKMFRQHYYIALSLTEDTMYVSDEASDSIMGFTEDMSKKLVHRCDELLCPLKIVVNKNGSLYVCALISSNVYQFSENFGTRRVLLSNRDGLLRPSSISLCETTSNLYVGMKGHNAVRVYHIQ